MTITFVTAIDLDGNSIENVKQLSSPDSVATVGKINTDLSAKADISHLHVAVDIQDLTDILQNLTLDGGVL